MRIPSQFNEDSLYGRRSGRANSAQSTRRVIRLCVILLLVMVVMQQAAKPGMYAVFFGEQSDAPQAVASDVKNGSVPAPSILAAKLPSADEATSAAAAKIARSLDRGQQQLWMTILSRWNQQEPFSLMRPIAAEVPELIGELTDISVEQQSAFADTFVKFQRLYAKGELRSGTERSEPDSDQDDSEVDASTQHVLPAVELSNDDQVRLVAVLGALDQLAIDRIAEGGLQAADFDAFYRQLNQAPFLDARQATRIAVVPLLQQPEVYRGRLVRVSGKIALVEPMEAAANPFGISELWKLWIKPDTGADRPIVFAVPSLPKSILKKTESGRQPKGEFVGRFFKRLPYRSQMGADVAPLVIGRMEVATPVATSASRRSTATPAQQSSQFLWIAAVTSLVGFGIAAFLMWRTSVSAKRTRQIRASNRSSDLALDGLDGLTQNSSDSESST